MANIKYTGEQIEEAQALRDAGKTLKDISWETGIELSVLSRRTTANGKSKKQMQMQIADEVRVAKAKANLTDVERQVVDQAVSKQVRDLEYLQSVAIKNVKKAMKADAVTQDDYYKRAGTIGRARETVEGKAPLAAVQVNLSNQIDAEHARRLAAEILVPKQ